MRVYDVFHCEQFMKFPSSCMLKRTIGEFFDMRSNIGLFKKNIFAGYRITWAQIF